MPVMASRLVGTDDGAACRGALVIIRRVDGSEPLKPTPREWDLLAALTGGGEALELLRRVPGIDLVLVDINMPPMDGLTLLLWLPEVDPLLRAMIASAHGDMTNMRTGINRGAFDVVTKPVDFDELGVTL